ncbi:hypothetical protein FPQ18DRAFT_376260 [Pyronema domesticum]|nr:hypothetical protein FPQ18DRAFT_376260 [Pyronema domesticum]
MSKSDGEKPELDRNMSKSDGKKPEINPRSAGNSNATDPSQQVQKHKKVEASSPTSDAGSWGILSPSEERPELPTLRSEGSMVIVGSGPGSPTETSSGSDSRPAESPEEPHKVPTIKTDSATATLPSTSTSKAEPRHLSITELEDAIAAAIDETIPGSLSMDELEDALLEKATFGTTASTGSSRTDSPSKEQSTDFHGTELLGSMDKGSLPSTVPQSLVVSGSCSPTASDVGPSSSEAPSKEVTSRPTSIDLSVISNFDSMDNVSLPPSGPEPLVISGIPKFSNPPTYSAQPEREEDQMFPNLPGRYGEKCSYPGCGEKIEFGDRIWFLDCDCSVVHRQCWTRKVRFGCPWCDRRVKSWTMNPTERFGQDDSISEI